jgi:CubicO group peptidase (beta-lactamase class C family)
MEDKIARRTFVGSALGLVASSCAHAAPADRASRRELEELVRHRIVAQRVATAAVVGTLDPIGRDFIVERANETHDRSALGADAIFEIASLTKVFTALLLAVEVVNGRVEFDEPVQALLPAGTTIPSFDGRHITLADLATHTSGLPLRPNTLIALPDTPNKYASFSLDQLYAGLSQYRLTRAPGSEFEYSNTGFGLLGQVLALREGMRFADLLRERVTGPLGLHDTTFDDDAVNAPRRAQGHDGDLVPIGPTSFGALDPAGGLRSSAADLLTFLRLFVAGRGPRDLVAAARLMLTLDRPGDDGATRMVLGWRRTRVHGEEYYWSNGSGDGSRTFMGFNPARGSAIVALADAANGLGLDDIGRRFLDPLQDVDRRIVPAPAFVTLAEDVLARAFGRYEYAPGDAFEVSRGATGLIVDWGPSQMVIRPVSPTRYETRMAPGIAFDFVGADVGPASAVVLHQDGQDFTYGRVAADDEP